MKRTAFTLIELLVVIAILCILGSILVGTFLPGCGQAATETVTITVARMEWDHRLNEGTVWTEGETLQVRSAQFGDRPEDRYGQLREQGTYRVSIQRGFGHRLANIVEILEAHPPDQPEVPAEAQDTPVWP